MTFPSHPEEVIGGEADASSVVTIRIVDELDIFGEYPTYLFFLIHIYIYKIIDTYVYIYITLYIYIYYIIYI